MMNKALTLGVLAVLGWLFINGSHPLTAPKAQSSASRTIPPDASVTPYAAADRSIVLEARRAPVPLVRSLRALPVAANLPDVLVPDPEAQKQDDLDKRAAKAAIEADGYKWASVLGKGADGSWRAKAYRGSTEVQLTVDGTGRVTLD
jgi:hypothetical protein